MPIIALALARSRPGVSGIWRFRTVGSIGIIVGWVLGVGYWVMSIGYRLSAIGYRSRISFGLPPRRSSARWPAFTSIDAPAAPTCAWPVSTVTSVRSMVARI